MTVAENAFIINCLITNFLNGFEKHVQRNGAESYGGGWPPDPHEGSATQDHFQIFFEKKTMTLVPQIKLQNKKLVKWSKTLIKRTYEKKSGKQMLQKVRTYVLHL